MDLSGIQFKEVDAGQLKYMDPAQREAANSARQSLGAEYAGKWALCLCGHVCVGRLCMRA